MNKSKFLKKSLAIVLAVMMVVAMIPLSASANTVMTNGDAEIAYIATTVGTLTGSGNEFTDTFKYSDSTAETITITLKDSTDSVEYTVYDADGEEDSTGTATTASGATATISSIDVDSSKVVFNVVSSDYDEEENEGTKSADYTVNFVKPAATGDWSIKSAVLNENGTTTSVTGVVDNAKATVTFTAPWGYTNINDNDKAKITYALNNPVTGSETVTETLTLDEDDATSFTVTAQNDKTKNWTAKYVEMTGLTSVSVAGVAAVQDKDSDGELIDNEYTVTLPADTDFNKAVAVKYTVATNNGVYATKAVFGTTGSLKEFTNGASAYKATADGDITVSATSGSNVFVLKLTSNKGTSEEYKITVETEKSDNATISAFTATGSVSSTNYTENGTVGSDNNLSVVMPYGTDLSSLKVKFTVATDATIEVNGTTYTNNGTGTIDLSSSKTATVVVTAQDGTTKAYYTISASCAESVSGKPQITAAKLVLQDSNGDDVEYPAVVDTTKQTITFNNIPYSTTDTALQSAIENIAWSKSFATVLTDGAYGKVAYTASTATGADFVDGTFTTVITADNTESETYTLFFKKAAAKTNKTLESLTVATNGTTTAITGDKVTDDNTVKATVSSKKVTISLPYSYNDAKGVALVPTFTVGEGATVYINDTTNSANLGSEIKSGFYTEAGTSYSKNEAKSSFSNSYSTASGTTTYDVTTIVVADEAATVEIGKVTGTLTLDELKAAPYKGHVTIYTIEWKYDAAKTGYKFVSFTDKGTEKITSKATEDKLTVTVPSSYVSTATSDSHIAKFELSPMAKAYTDSATRNQLTSETSAFSVVADTNGDYHLQFTSGTDCDIIYVVSEAGEKNPVEVEVIVSDAKTGADLESITIGGVKGTINTTDRTAKVALPYGTDLSDLVIDYTVSDMATAEFSASANFTTDSDSVNHIDASAGSFTITITAESGTPVKVYTVTVTTASQFSDVDATAYYADDVYAAASAGIIKGYANGTFKPNNNITRRDFAIMVTRMLDADTSSYTTAAFPDVKSGDYGLAAIAYCSDKGIITGRPNGKFAPDEYITRQDAAIIIARALELTSTATTTEFKDNAKIRTDAVASVAAAAAAGIIEGDTNGNFRPTDNIKRCDAAAIMVRALNK